MSRFIPIGSKLINVNYIKEIEISAERIRLTIAGTDTRGNSIHFSNPDKVIHVVKAADPKGFQLLERYYHGIKKSFPY